MKMSITNEVVSGELRKLLEHLRFKNYTLTLTSNSNKGDNYLGVIYFVKVCGVNELGEKEKLHLVVKCAEPEEEKRSFVPVRRAYEREVYCYGSVFKAFRRLQKDLGVEEPFDSFPKCLSSSLKENAEAIIFEDLKTFGYRLWDRKVTMDKQHLALVLSQYGKLHALTFGLREKDPKGYKILTSKLDNILGDSGQNFKSMMEAAYERCVGALEEFGYVEEIRKLKVVKPLLGSVFSLGDCEEEHQVICHGDGWCNNFMFKYKNKKVSGMRFLDWQIARMATPIVDLSYFFYTSAGKEDLDDLEKYQKIYHDSLSSFLKEMQCDPLKLFPFEVFKEHWKKYSKYGLVTSFLLLHIMHLDSSEAPDLTDAGFTGSLDKPIKEEGKYKKRVVDVVLHFIRNGFI